MIIRCEKCGSYHTRFYNVEKKFNTFNNKNEDKVEYKKVLYNIECLDCGTCGVIVENWLMKKEDEIK